MHTTVNLPLFYVSFPEEKREAFSPQAISPSPGYACKLISPLLTRPRHKADCHAPGWPLALPKLRTYTLPTDERRSAQQHS